jgi:hypothetical protein
MATITIVGVGGFVVHGDVDQARPVGRGSVLDVDQATADRLIADGVAIDGEHDIHPVLPPEPSTVGAADEPVDYAELSKDELQAEVDRRGITVEGSGANGNVVKDDLVAALEADDAA